MDNKKRIKSHYLCAVVLLISITALVTTVNAASITLTSPNDGDTWELGTFHAITWSQSGLSGTPVRIDLYKNQAFYRSIGFAYADDGFYYWTIPMDIPESDLEYDLHITSMNYFDVFDYSHLIITSEDQTITVIFPNGVGVCEQGSYQEIKWSYTMFPSMAPVKIVLLKGNNEVRTISSSTSIGVDGAGSYIWPIDPTEPTGTDYRVKVQSINQPTISDTSNNYFSIIPSTQTISITSPNGGETWQQGTSHTISWSYTNFPSMAPVKIVLLKGNNEVRTISSSTSIGVGETGSYIWPIDPTEPTGADYRVKVQSINHPTISDTSNYYFTISAAPQTSTITVTSPNGGETWYKGSNHAITWTSSGDVGSFVKIEVLIGSSVVQTLSSSTENDGTYSWTISELGTDIEYRIRITSTSNSEITDSSNAYFTIWPGREPTIIVTSPNGGETWYKNSNHAITWTSSGDVGSFVKIEVLKANSVAQTLSSSTENDGTFSWTISTALAEGVDYRIRITSTSNPGILGHSNNYFTITAGTTNPSITVTSPNGGESWQQGTSHTITWSYNGDVGSTVRIELLKPGALNQVIIASTSTGTGGAGSYTWPIPTTQTLGNDYTIQITSTTNPAYSDVSNNPFSIVAEPPLASITVTSPNGGESWQQGTSHTITWSYNGDVGSTVRIELLKPGALNQVIIASTSTGTGGAGSYTWPIPTTQTLGNDYTIRISSTSLVIYSDISNAPFTITLVGSTKTNIGIYNGGNWYMDYNGDGQFTSATGDKYIPYGATGWTQLVGDWNGDGISEIGIYKDGLWYIDYGGSGVIDANTKYYSFGGVGWTPIVGDWDANKKDEIGVYNAGNWYLDYNGNGVWDTGDKNYGFGTTGWTPVVGKWTSDGYTKIGIYNGGNWYIDYNGDGQFTSATGDKYIPYGATGWTQLVGDWNGDGISEIGIYKDAVWYIDYGGSGVIDTNTRYYQFGAADWTPVTGDWNGDKKDKIGVYQNGNWYIDNTGNGAWDTGDKNYGFGAAGWTPVVGKW